MRHANPPTLTLAAVLCTRDRPESLLRTLESLRAQHRRPDELILIDDGCMDENVRRQIDADFQAAGIPVVFARNESPGLTRARNLAARLAASDVLLYLDDDVTCDPDVLGEVARLFEDPAVTVLTCNVQEPTFASPAARLYQLGYVIAGWWRVAPRVRPRSPRPAVLKDPSTAVPARWLSGAAMAFRREVIRQHPFDESLAAYALGEDREMGYRLVPEHWLLEARRARVVHRRDPAARTDPRRLGFMTTRNYLVILNKSCRLGPGDWLLIVWSLLVLATMHLAWSLGQNRRTHLAELRGMLDGLLDFARHKTPTASRVVLDPGARFDSMTNHTRQSKTRRVLFVTNRLEPGGAELMLVDLVRLLPRYGIEPHILCLKDAGPLASSCRDAGIPVFDRLLRHKTDAAVIPRLRQLLRERRIDALVVAHSGGDRMFWSTLAAGLSEIPVLVWSHWFPRAGRRHIERPNRALYRLIDAFIALGPSHRRALIRYEHVPAGRIAVVPNAIDLARFLHDVSRDEARRRLRLEPHHLAVGIVANLRREKRHDVFIEAARQLARDDDRLRFFIIGDGPDRDAVQAAAARSGLDHETLRLLGPRDDVPVLLAGLDIACLCSDIECYSVAMLEAAAAGCPFIAPAVGCLPDFLVDGVNGLLIRPGDADSLRAALRRLVDDPDLRTSLARNARDKVNQECSLERMAARFTEVLLDTLDAHAMKHPADYGWHGCSSRGERLRLAVVKD